jgi:hypothetical protein
MTDFKSIDEYKNYADKLRLSELKDIERKIDRYKYKDRYDLLISIIKEKESGSIAEEYINNKTYYPPGVRIIYNVYKFIVIIGAIVLPIAILLKHKLTSTNVIFAIIFVLSVDVVILYGISRKKPWIVLLVLFYSYISLLSELFKMLAKKDIEFSVVDLCLNFAYTVFIIYSIYVFSRKDTKLYFKHQDNVVI